jgi:hypothetical protein
MTLSLTEYLNLQKNCILTPIVQGSWEINRLMQAVPNYTANV